MDFIAFLFEMLHYLFTGGWLGVILGLLLVFVMLVFVVAIVGSLFYALDSWFRPKKQAPGIIDGHSFTPARVTVISTGTSIIPQYIPKSWSIGIRIGNRRNWMSCSKECHDKYDNNQEVIATFKSGRLSGRMYVQSISPA
jgi:hypothetical protein